MVEKILLMGRPSMGKTTIKKVVFEKENPDDLILFPLDATISTKYSVYDFMDLKLSLLDTAGQSLPIYLSDKDKQIEIFGDTSVLIYIFDYNIWLSNPQVVVDDIKKIYKINENEKKGSKIFLFFHKIDLVYQLNEAILSLLKSRVMNQLDLPVELPLFFTSLHPKLIFSIYNAFFAALSNFSIEVLTLKNVVQKIFNELSKTICFITNKDDYIINHIEAKDFDIDLIHLLHEKLYHLSKSYENLTTIDNVSKIIEVNSKFFYIAIDNISEFHPNFKNAIILSEIHNCEKLNEILKEIKSELSKTLNITN